MSTTQETRSTAEQTVVLILAAGKGTRMRSPDREKVCFDIDSVPAINRAITAFRERGFTKFLVVVGAGSEEVLTTVAKAHPAAMYVYQEPQLGTGHAAKIAAGALKSLEYTENVLVTMGDKFIEGGAIDLLISEYVKQQPDLALLTVPKGKSTKTSGRVILDKSGQAVDIIEATDLARQRVVDELRDRLAGGRRVSGADIRDVVNRHIPSPRKQEKALGKLLSLATGGGKVGTTELRSLLESSAYNIEIGGKRVSADEIERLAKGMNPSLYLFRAEAFYQGVDMIDKRNAQGEYYLTDVVKALAAVKTESGTDRFKIRAVASTNPDCVQGFNSPDELLSIQDYVRRKKLHVGEREVGLGRPRLGASQYGTVKQWIAKVERDKPSLRRWLAKIYGDDEGLHAQKKGDLLRVLRCYGRRFGYEQKVCIVRAPGRLNLMGRHVDHKGGYNNFLAIDRETVAVVGARDDDSVVAVNTDPRQFRPVRFSISETIGGLAWRDWMNFVNSDWVRNMIYSSSGDWGNYIKAAAVRLQHKYQDVRIRGVNIAVSGNVPIAAGLSSSSTIVVAAVQAMIALNNFEVTSGQFIDVCGDGEWFVGSHGGAGAHAAIYLGQRGKIAHVGYFPFRVEEILDAPAGHQVMLADSHVHSARSGTAMNTFNARNCSYSLGLALLKQRCPEIASTVEYVRDLDPSRMGWPTSDIYRLLLRVPTSVTRRDFRRILSSDHADLIERSFASHPDPKAYDVRGVLLFGAAESMRSRIGVDYLARGEVEKFGCLMKISHDGDRVSCRGSGKRYTRVAKDVYGDEFTNQLIADLACEDPERVLGAQLYMQPGSYRCSTPAIDRMVDVVSDVPGVEGAQMAGAGLGGCIMILARKDCVAAAREALVREYYRPKGLKPSVISCTATEGAGLAEF